jgi:prephenate dehydratase
VTRDLSGRTVGFQGERGAYSELAVYKHFGEGEVNVIPFEDLSDVFDAVVSGQVQLGIVPIENSLAGSIGETFDLLINLDVTIAGEVAIAISHCLIGNKGGTVKDVKRVYSHPQALEQCREFLSKMKLEQVPAYDTAGSVKLVKQLEKKENAAIASEVAAKIYEMEILAKNIEDEKTNQTRFLIISKKERAPPTSSDKTSVIFSTKHAPGALVRALSCLSSWGINMDRIESRPMRSKPWEYFFYVDFDGHQENERVREALADLKKNSEYIKILGSYPKTVS